MLKDCAAKTMNAVHRGLLGISRGKLGGRVNKMPVIQLTTTGRKSGLPRSVMVTVPLTLGPTLVVAASWGGDDRHPVWFLNLRDNPEVEVAAPGGSARAMRARIASPGERESLWPRVVARSESYRGYQSRTDREIPLVLLEPLPGQ